ncbi:MAG: class I SAM-dependent methyltransferase [Acidobacteriota bacterium]|nr:class I SAM-dependent methyltransferase [Acidobacteriota bacterium]
MTIGHAEAMRHEWDERANKDAFYYIASWRKDWNISDFLKSGDDDYNRLVVPVLEHFGFSSGDKVMIELGCGAGRMTHSFASHFATVLAFDASKQMIDHARQLLKNSNNVSFLLVKGAALAGAADQCADFVFSYLVLQHLPEEQLVLRYIHEMLRVLRPDGLCLFQFNGAMRSSMNWNGRLAWGAIDALWSIRLRTLSRTLARFLGFDPEMAGKTWHGVRIPADRILRGVREEGGTVLEIHGVGSPMAWCCARKARPR